MKSKTNLLELYRSYTGRTYARPNHYNTISYNFESRIVQEYSYIPDYLTGEI